LLLKSRWIEPSQKERKRHTGFLKVEANRALPAATPLWAAIIISKAEEMGVKVGVL